jgi:hypothetical protein
MRTWKPARRLAVAAAFALLSAGPTLAQTFEGDWEGTLDTGQEKLRGVVHVLPTATGLPDVTLDSVDQGVMDIPGKVMKAEGPKVEMLFISVGASLAGTVSADGKAFTGVYSQNGRSFPFNMTRRAPAKP